MRTRDDLIAQHMAAVEAPPLPPRPGLLAARTRTLDQRLGAVLGFRTATDFLYALRPGLWTTRALAAGIGLFLILGGVLQAPEPTWTVMVVLSALASLALLVPSVHIGRSGSTTAEAVATLVAFALLLAGLFITG